MEKYYQNLYFQKLLQVQKNVYLKKGMFGHNRNFRQNGFFNRLQHTTTHTYKQ